MKSVVLLSGGLDSSVNFWIAKQKSDVSLALTFNYGQRANTAEVKAAANLAEALSVPHLVLDLTWFKSFGTSSLLDRALNVPKGSGVSIDDLVVSAETAKSVWVPNRNGIFLNIAAGFAESLGANWVVPGFNKEEAATFLDNTEDYMKSLDQSFSFSTANKVKVKCFTSPWDKTQIVSEAIKLKFPFEMLWPCYFSGPKWCGECESCQRSKRAMKANGLDLQNQFEVW